MPKESILYGVIGLLAGIVIMGFTTSYAVNNEHAGIMNVMGIHGHDSDDMSMGEMTDELKGKTGDAFDEAFLEQMLAHHQGAINMSRLVERNAKHDEVKRLANDIMTSQSNEIEMMQTWQGQWGYKNVPSSHMH